jgi:ElaA protein
VAPIWKLEEFAALSTVELYALLRLRQAVFVVEQRCPYADADGLDPRAAHLFCSDGAAADGAPRVIAGARLFAPGVQAAEAVIGRVVTAPEVRRSGLGRVLMARAIEAVELRHGPTPIRIGAQKYLERFYFSFGFRRDGEDYLEDDIPHLPMRRPAHQRD